MITDHRASTSLIGGDLVEFERLLDLTSLTIDTSAVTEDQVATVLAMAGLSVPARNHRRQTASDQTDSVGLLRSLAAEGRLAEVVRSATGVEWRQLSGAAYSLVYPLVFERLTRAAEMRRGHWACSTGVTRLADECLDRFYDDTEAVVEYVLTRTTGTIRNLDAWIVTRLRQATVDSHRRRRGARGALQRPRLPQWLARLLDSDPWLSQLALEILVWVGVPTASGPSSWPLDLWAERRAIATGDCVGSDRRAVEHDLDVVLAAMRQRPEWYADYVERPLGTKTPPMAREFVADSAVVDSAVVESRLVALVQPGERDDARLQELAAVALAAMEARLESGVEPTRVVSEVMTRVFGEMDIPAAMSAVPLADTNDEQVAVRLRDPAGFARIVEVVQEIFTQRSENSDPAS